MCLIESAQCALGRQRGSVTGKGKNRRVWEPAVSYGHLSCRCYGMCPEGPCLGGEQTECVMWVQGKPRPQPAATSR